MEDLQYVTVEPMRWDAIAYKAYGDANQSELIIKANPEIQISDVLPAGMVVNIPVIEESTLATDPELLPPWKQI